MLKRTVNLTGALVLALAVMAMSAGELTAQSKSKKSASKSSTAKKSTSTTKKADAKLKGRLPNFYGQLELKDEQRLEIYKVQLSYQEDIADLEEKLAALREKLNDAYEDVLTTTQKRALSKLRTAASSTSSSSKSTSKPKTSSSSKSSSSKSKK